MDLATLIFWIIAFVLVGSALVVVIQRNIVHSALALILVFAMASGIYLLLNAEFIAIVQILIYAGAVAVLILFALMLTRTSTVQVNSNPNGKLWWLALPICALVAVGILFATTVSPYATTATTNLVGYGDKATCALPRGLRPMGLTLNHFLVLGALLFCIGLYGALAKRNAIAVLMGIEIMLNAVNITMVGFSFFNHVKPYSTFLTGQIFAIFIITVAAAEAAVALAMIIAIYRRRSTVDVGEIDMMKW